MVEYAFLSPQTPFFFVGGEKSYFYILKELLFLILKA